MHSSLSELQADITAKLLVHLGVEKFYYSPGFRNASFVRSFSKEYLLKESLSSDTVIPGTTTSVTAILDERGLAFTGIGEFKKSAKPAVICVTSGTAVGNLLPGIMEAHKSKIPLILITADREAHEHRLNANQTIKQANIFKPFVRYSEHFELDNDPDANNNIDVDIKRLKFILSNAYQEAISDNPGPVHVNIAVPDPNTKNQASELFTEDALPTKEVTKNFDQGIAQEIINKLGESPKSAIIIGIFPFTEDEKRQLVELSEKTESMLIAEGLLSADLKNSSVINPEYLTDENRLFDYALYFGYDFIERRNRDRLRKLAHNLIRISDMNDCIDSLPSAIQTFSHLVPKSVACDSGFKRITHSMCDSIRLKRATYLSKEDSSSISEPMFHFIASDFWENSELFLANSMIPRDFSAFAMLKVPKPLRVHFNRGVSGIDGILHTCLGVGLGSSHKAPSVIRRIQLVIGDLSFLHDISALTALQEYSDRLNFSVWVLNNGGGEIFRNVADASTLLTTPFKIDFEQISRAANLEFAHITTCSELEDSLKIASTSKIGIRIFEIKIDPVKNEKHRRECGKIV